LKFLVRFGDNEQVAAARREFDMKNCPDTSERELLHEIEPSRRNDFDKKSLLAFDHVDEKISVCRSAHQLNAALFDKNSLLRQPFEVVDD